MITETLLSGPNPRQISDVTLNCTFPVPVLIVNLAVSLSPGVGSEAVEMALSLYAVDNRPQPSCTGSSFI
jgi:hypothetical protein